MNKWYHIEWIAKVGGELLRKKGIKVEEYCNDLVELNFPLDTLGLLVIARMFHNHITVILKERIWTTQANNDIDCCSIFLIYSDGVNFVDTCTGRPSFLSDHSISDLENIDEQIDAINLCQSSVEIVLKPHLARMRHAAPKRDRNCANKCSNCYGLRSSAPKKPVKPKRNTRNSNKVLMNINLDSLWAGNCQKNVQKKQEPVVVVDSETETVESTDDELKQPSEHENKENKDRDANQNNETPMEVSETETQREKNDNENPDDNRDNQAELTETETPMEVSETETQREKNDNENPDDNGDNQAELTEMEIPMEVSETEALPEKNDTKNPVEPVNQTETEIPKKDNEKRDETVNESETDIPNKDNKKRDETVNETESDTEIPQKDNEKRDETETLPEKNDTNNPVEQNKDNEKHDETVNESETDIPNKDNEKPDETVNGTETETPEKDNDASRNRTAKPSELKEKDPILEAFRNVQSHEDLEVLLVDYTKKKHDSSKVSETDIKTQNGTVNVKQYGLLKSPLQKDRSLGCSECDVKKTTIAELTKHIKEAHPGFKYKCSQCERLFDTYNGRTKHENKHYLFKYACVFCLKCFQFLKRLNEHLFLHTGVGGYKCPSRGCKSVVTSKDNLKIHMQIHDLKEFPCTECKKVFHSFMST